MKRIVYLLTVIAGVLFVSCSGNNSSAKEKVEEDSITDPFLLDDINPVHDFISVIDGDTAYFRILEGGVNVSLTYWRRSNFENHVIHIPSEVINGEKSYPVREIGAEAMGVEFYGDREGHTLWFTDNHLIDTVYVPSSVRNIDGSAFTARFRSERMQIVLKDSVEYLGAAAVNCMDIRDEKDAIILPANIVGVNWLIDDEDHEIEDFKFTKLYIPEHLEYIGGLDMYERNQPLFKKVEVHPCNKHFRAINGVLFNYDLTELYWSTVNEKLYIPKGVRVDKAKISELEDGWYPHLQLPDFKSIRTEPGNPYCIAIDDVLYDIKNKCMIMSTDNPDHTVHVPSWCNSVYLLEGCWHKPSKYMFSDKANREDVDSFIKALKRYTYDGDDTIYKFTYKGRTWNNKE